MPQKQAFFLAVTAVLLVSGCKKYDQNGSLLHFKTPEARLIGDWRSAEVSQVGTADSNLTEFMASGNLLLDASFQEDHSVTIVNVNDDITYEGTWDFNDDKSVLHLDELTFTKMHMPACLFRESLRRRRNLRADLTFACLCDAKLAVL